MRVPQPLSYRLFWLLGVIAATSVGHSIAQPVTVTVYHGLNDSRGIRVQEGEGEEQWRSVRSLPLSLDRGSQVCVEVVNAHPILYAYSIETDVDTTSTEGYDFSAITAVLNPLLDATQAATSGASALSALSALAASASKADGGEQLVPDGGFGWLEAYQGRIGALAGEIRDVRKAVVESASPERYDPVSHLLATNEERGVTYARRVVNDDWGDFALFDDPDLGQIIAAWKTEATEEVATLPSELQETFAGVVEALYQQSRALLSARNTLQAAYAEVSPLWRDCAAVGEGLTTLTLGVQPRDTSIVKSQRDTGPVFKVVATPHYAREAVEIIPIAFAAVTDDVPAFSIRDGAVVREAGEEANFGAGMMVVANAFEFGPRRSLSVGAGLGVALIGDDRLFSGLYATPMLSFLDTFRVGVGYGFHRVASGLKSPAVVGQPLPADAGELNDLLEIRSRGSLFVTFSITGLGIPLK